jgi:hypothetical protein
MDVGREALVESGVPDIPAFWSEYGRPGWNLDLGYGTGTPWSYAGLVVGGWQFDEPAAPQLPFPGAPQVQVPPSWFDTLVVSEGNPARDGFDAGLARAWAARLRPPPGDKLAARTIADLMIAGGSSAYDENALWVRRGDQAKWLEVGALDWKIGGLGGDIAPSGRHLYGAAAGWTKGRHHLEGGFAQRGTAGALFSGEEQSVTGVSGYARYGYDLLGGRLGVTGGSSYDHHESVDENFDFSRRDARARWASVGWEDSSWRIHAMARSQRIARTTDFAPEQRWSSPAVWLGFEATRGTGRTRLHAGLGLGRDDATGETTVAPTASLTYRKSGFLARVHAGRYATPVWSDLASGQAPFLQRTLAAGVELGLERRPGFGVRGGWQMGHTTERAVVARLPLEDLWLRSGFLADPKGYTFGLATASFDWTRSHFGLGGESFLLVHERSNIQPDVDPKKGGRAWVETGFHAFAGDLGVKLRAELEVTGGRETEDLEEWLPGYANTGLTAIGTLADASLIFRVVNLENERHFETWTDSVTGLPAEAPGREFRLALVWRMYN